MAAVFHPIAWTDEEMRFAVVAPAAVGALLFFGALAVGRLDVPITVGSLSITPLFAATVAGGILWVTRDARGSGNLITESRPVRGFDQIAVSGNGTLIVKQGAQESLTIEAELSTVSEIALKPTQQLE